MAVRLFVAAAALPLLLGACVTPSDATDSQTEASREAITTYARMLTSGERTNDTFKHFFAPGLIQHDPWIADGNKGDEEFLEARHEDNPDKYDRTEDFVNVTHTIMADGDLVAIKSHVFTNAADTGRIFVDIWRMKDGQFIEHWDVIQPIAEEMREAVGCGKGISYETAKAIAPTVERPVCGNPDPAVDSEESRRIVSEYLAMGQQPGRLVEALETYNHPNLVQHARRIPGGRQGLIDYMVARADERAADERTSHIARILADGDMVMVHRRVTRKSDPTGQAIVDLFRLKGGKIIEHWDIVQPIPAFSVSGRSMVEGPLEPGRYKGPPPADEDE